MKKLFYAMMTLLSLIALLSCGPPPTPEEKQRFSERIARERSLTHAKRSVKSVLRDPDSAVFGAVYNGRDDAVCGAVNAKNSFGGYTGPQLFMTYKNELRMGAALPLSLWNRYCMGLVRSITR